MNQAFGHYVAPGDTAPSSVQHDFHALGCHAVIDEVSGVLVVRDRQAVGPEMT